MKKDNSLSLLDYCETQTTIRCEKCKGKDVTNSDDMDSCDILFDKGWKVIKEVVHCPKCAKKAK